MVINRIQSLYLLLAAGLMVLFMFMPFASTEFLQEPSAMISSQPIKGVELPGVWIPAAVSALFALLAVLMYKTPSAQRAVLALSVVLMLTVIGVTLYVIFVGLGDTDPSVITVTRWSWADLLVVVAIILALMADGRIRADRALLRSYDRIR